MKLLLTKLKDAMLSVLPITLIVCLLHWTRIAPLDEHVFPLFLICAFLLVIGMALFTLGADTAMMPMGSAIGASLTKTKKLWIILILAFLLGTLITIAEPDLAVLSEKVPINPSILLVLIVAIGVGLFLMVGIFRIIFQKSLNVMLIFFYALVFMLTNLCGDGFLALAFDSGGVTTGPITVPFIMALCAGFAAVRGGKRSNEDSFGLIALCSIGPIMVVAVMGLFVKPVYEPDIYEVSPYLFHMILKGSLLTMKEVAIAILPVVAFFFIYQTVKIRLPKRQLIKIIIGVIYTFVGLVLFLTAVNVGFSMVGSSIGEMVANRKDQPWLIVLLGALMGFVVVLAEPAVAVLTKQVEEISGGTIKKRAMLISLSVGVGISIALSILRIQNHFNIMFYLVPGYAIILGLSFFVPKIYTAIAFDSGGVASGPMTSTFILPFAIGVCKSVNGTEIVDGMENYLHYVMPDAFGIIAMVAMTPLLTIQLLGFKVVMSEALARKKARARIKDADEAQIIYFD